MSEIKVSNSVEANVQTPLREDLIQTAVRFLTHPNVVPRPLDQKKSFLVSKGLTENEMQEAIARSSANTLPPTQTHVPFAVPVHQPAYQLAPDLGPFEKLRRILHTLLLLGGFGYGVYWVYKTYIEPFLFGKKGPKRKPVDERVTDLEATVNNSIAEIRVELGELGKSTSAANKVHEKLATFQQVKELQGDLSSVKGLLLSRQQFPPAPSITPLKSTVSIPAWQLSESVADGETQSDNSTAEDTT